jgi:hypothetical protein
MGTRHQNSNVNQSPEVPEFHQIVALELSRHASDSRFQLRRATEQQNKKRINRRMSRHEFEKKNLAAENTVQREPVQLT